MQVSVEKIGGLERKIHIEIPKDKVESKVDDRLKKLVKTTKIQGFRPGKVPLSIIKNRYSSKVHEEVVGDLVQSSFYEAIAKEKLNPVGYPKVENLSNNENEDLSFTATIEVFPDIKLTPISEYKFERCICEVTEKDVTKMINNLRKQKSGKRPVERVAKKGDILDINFEGFIKGKPFEGNKAENYLLELGTKSFIEGFEEGLIGKASGDDLVLKLCFPKKYADEKLKGKDVEFKVKINSVNEPELPEIDAKFMEQFGVKNGDKDSFQNEIKRNMEREAKLTLRNKIKDKVFNELYAKNKIELPKAMVEQEESRIRSELENNFKTQGLDPNVAISKIDSSLLSEQAKKRTSLQLLVAEVVKQNDLKAEKSKVDEMIEQVSSAYEKTEEVKNWYYSDEKRLREVEALVLEEVVVDWILSKANIEERTCGFDEVMNKNQTAKTN